jgi:hypothetical protein
MSLESLLRGFQAETREFDEGSWRLWLKALAPYPLEAVNEALTDFVLHTPSREEARQVTVGMIVTKVQRVVDKWKSIEIRKRRDWCGLCDEQGWTQVSPRVIKGCDHPPEAVLHVPKSEQRRRFEQRLAKMPPEERKEMRLAFEGQLKTLAEGKKL